MKINKLAIVFNDNVDVSEIHKITKKVVERIEYNIRSHNDLRPAHLPLPKKVTGGSAFYSFPIHSISYEVTLK